MYIQTLVMIHKTILSLLTYVVCLSLIHIYYFENIRKYNLSFAMVSSEAKISDTVMRGVYHFKIHNVFYHRSGPVTAGYGLSLIPI